MKTRFVWCCAVLGWGLLALSLVAPAPAVQSDTAGGGGVAGGCPQDINGDNVVDVVDLLALLGAWGPCPVGCLTHSDCNDANVCTLDQCVAGNCQNTPIAGCCLSAGDCPPIPNAVAGCSQNQCVIIGCSADYQDCDLQVANGCEVYVPSDPAHCGGCNMPCIDGNPCTTDLCANGSCIFVPVPDGTPCPGGTCTNGLCNP